MAARRLNFALRSAHKTGNTAQRAASARDVLSPRRTFGEGLEVRKSRPRDQILYTGFARGIASQEETSMAETVVTLRLNQQQLELLDRTIAQGIAPDRVSLVRLALREYAAAHRADTAAERAR
jgi:hypothetical protein